MKIGWSATIRRDGAQWSTIEIAWVVFVVAAVIMGGCAVFAASFWKWLLVAGGLFSALAAMAVGINAEWLAALDTSVEAWFEAHRSRRWKVDAGGMFRFLGSPLHVGSVALVCGGLLSVRARSVIPVVLVIGGVSVGVAVEQILKATIGRTATTVAEQHDKVLLHYEHSFPSGHVTGSAALLGMIAVCIGTGGSRAVKVALAVPVVAGVLFVAWLALYTGAHTFTDVIGGMFLGGGIVALGVAVLVATASRRAPAAAPVDDLSPSYR